MSNTFEYLNGDSGLWGLWCLTPLSTIFQYMVAVGDSDFFYTSLMF